MNALIGDLCVCLGTGSHIYTEQSVDFVLRTFRENGKRKYYTDIKRLPQFLNTQTMLILIDTDKGQWPCAAALFCANENAILQNLMWK